MAKSLTKKSTLAYGFRSCDYTAWNKQSFLYDLMKKNWGVNEMVNFGSALSTPLFPSEDEAKTMTGGEVMTSVFK